MTQALNYPYLDEGQLPYLFCPGCGHGKILDALKDALETLAIDPRKLVIVTDIGCAGLSDRYFNLNAFHGLHGRSVTYATGIKLSRPELQVIVLIGDGGVGIGGNHLINAARRNIGVTTLVFNNLNYGMTGGEHSVTTPRAGKTATTRFGQLETPLDICGTVAINGASFVARSTTFDKNLSTLIQKAIQNEGFSLIDIWELCTAHYVPNNKFSKKALLDTMNTLSLKTGVIREEHNQEYSAAYKIAHKDVIGSKLSITKKIQPAFSNKLTRALNIVIAGSAGAKIGSAATLFGHAAMLSGLWISQRNDYPVTVKSGHSIAELKLSPEEIHYPGMDKPDLMVVLFPEGLEKSSTKIASLTREDTLITSDQINNVPTKARKIKLDLRSVRKENRAVMALGAVLTHFGFFPMEAFKEAIKAYPQYAEENLAALGAGESLAIRFPI